MNNTTSIYIPRMRSSWTEHGVKHYMRKVGVGQVSHVDFIPVNGERGFSEDVCSGIMSAFVHFADPVLCTDGDYYWSSNSWNIQFWTDVSENNPTKLQVSQREYWMCFKNTNPVNRTRMNIHQVVDNCRYMEGVVASQAVEIASQAACIASQAEEIAALKKGLDNVTGVVYQLIGGLFNHRTQRATIKQHLDDIGMGGATEENEGPMELGELSDEEEDKDTNIWPTTHQGDELSEKIQNIERRLRCAEEQVGDLMELENCFGYSRSAEITSTLAAAEDAYVNA